MMGSLTTYVHVCSEVFRQLRGMSDSTQVQHQPVPCFCAHMKMVCPKTGTDLKWFREMRGVQTLLRNGVEVGHEAP